MHRWYYNVRLFFFFGLEKYNDMKFYNTVNVLSNMYIYSPKQRTLLTIYEKYIPQLGAKMKKNKIKNYMATPKKVYSSRSHPQTK